MRKYIFYDLETSGRSPKYDQPLQFAAIVTNDEFIEISRVNVRCKLAPHILPSPIALSITGVYPDQLYQADLPNAFEFAQFLQGFVRDNSPATWVGYNSIAFDENFLRQFFYQNLQPEIYATQSFGNDRLDVMKIAWAVFDECNEALIWPTNEKGKVSFKLEHIAPANGFLNANSHDALSDVEATIFLMKKMHRSAPELVDHLIQNRQKVHVKSLIESSSPLKVTVRYGGPPKTLVGCFCGYQKNNSNNFGFLDLGAANIDDILRASYEEIYEAVTKSPQRIKTFALNKGETIRPFKEADAALVKISQDVGGNYDLMQKVGTALANKFTKSEMEDKSVEEQIYDRFISLNDKTLLHEFQKVSWHERQYILDDIQDLRLKILGRRLLTFFGPKLNYSNWDEKFKKYLRAKWMEDGSKHEWNTFSQFDSDLETLRSRNDSNDLIEALEELKLRLLKDCDHY